MTKIQARRKAAQYLQRLGLTDPRFNLREILKQMLLLEDHLLQRYKFCPDCIHKHLLAIEAFSEEGVAMDKPNGVYTDALAGVAESARQWMEALHNGIPPAEIAQKVRSLRKTLSPVACDPRVVRVASRYLSGAVSFVPITVSFPRLPLTLQYRYEGSQTVESFELSRHTLYGLSVSSKYGEGVCYGPSKLSGELRNLTVPGLATWLAQQKQHLGLPEDFKYSVKFQQIKPVVVTAENQVSVRRYVRDSWVLEGMVTGTLLVTIERPFETPVMKRFPFKEGDLDFQGHCEGLLRNLQKPKENWSDPTLWAF